MIGPISPELSLPDPVLVVGCGLIGTSIALALRQRGVTVHLQDSNVEHLATAEETGAGTAEPVDGPELVVVAVPPSAVVEEVHRALADHPTSVVTDVASVKSPVVAATDDPRFVGGHPMAGRERSGPSAAVPSLFEGRPWAIVPGPATDPAAVAVLEALATGLRAVPARFDALTHDRSVALVSHVPQLVSSLTAGLLVDAPDRATDLAGPGLRDVTRIARSDTGLWTQIVSQNASQISELLVRLRDEIDLLIKDPEQVAEVLARGRVGTTRIPGKHGELPGDTAVVHVPIDDVPGELARLVADVGAAGINLEDLRIDHELGRSVGLVEIVVVPASADPLREALIDRGWAAYR